MAKHFYSFQFDMPYRPTYLRNWEVPKYYCPRPRQRSGSTSIISNSRGHLLPGVPKPPCNPFGDFIGTWEMPKKITREVANKFNGTADRPAFMEKCRLLASTPVRKHDPFIKEPSIKEPSKAKPSKTQVPAKTSEDSEDQERLEKVPSEEVQREVQILKTLILGEEERGQSQYQVMCFIFHFQKDSFISSDAMSKLRQKNPSTVRTPEEDLGRVNHTMDYTVVLKHSGIISPFIRDICAEAGQASYTRYEDVMKWSNIHGIPTASYQPALKRFPTTPDYINNEVLNYNDLPAGIANCTNIKNMWTPCLCHLEQCIGWYPCELKYCKGKGSSKGSVASYRCGIKTCKICHLFVYYIGQKQQCLWDE